MIRGVLFDMDGVLVDNLDAHLEAFAAFCCKYNVCNWQGRISELFGMGNDDIMRRLLPEELIAERGLKALGDEKEQMYRDIYSSTIAPVEGLPSLLAALNAAGIKCAVGSSGCADNVAFVLEKCNIEHLFSARVSGDMVTRCKPDPEIYLTAAKAIGIDSSECLVFEDSKAGVKAGIAAGMKVVALATTLPREELARDTQAIEIIDNFTQISVEHIAQL